jgi:hypothetical protein
MVASLQQDAPITYQHSPSLASLHGDTLSVTHLLAKPILFPRLEAIYVPDLMTCNVASITKFFENLARTPTSYLYTRFHLSEELKNWIHSFHQQPLSRRKKSCKLNLDQITTTYFSCPDNFMTDLPLWLSIFPKLDMLDINCLSVSIESQLTFVEKLAIEHPHIRIVTFDRLGGTLEDWRSGKLKHVRPPISHAKWMLLGCL